MRAGVPAVADPLGGSYFMEALTHKVEEGANAYIRRIDEMGGMIRRSSAATRNGDRERELRISARDRDRRAEIVGVNAFTEKNERPIEAAADR